MIFTFEGGVRSDDPPVGPNPFVLFSENLRWKRGLPETIGPYARLVNAGVLMQLPGIGDTDARVSIFQDRDYVVFGVGKDVHFLDWENQILTTVNCPAAADSGRWWFDATETAIFGARSADTGRVYAFPRSTLVPQVLANSPVGAVAGGIVASILVLAGTTSFATNPKESLVRWSARRTDPANGGGFVGFEDWTPTDINASGELPVADGAVVIGGGATSFGFVVFTDRSVHLYEPRDDLFAFGARRIASRGLYSANCWIEIDGRIWWFDQALELNVWDGGQASQVPCPLRHASTEFIPEEAGAAPFVHSSTKYGEVCLTYPDRIGQTRQLVYNYLEDVWYPWRLLRVAITDQTGARPGIGVDSGGYLWVHDLSETMRLSYLYGDGSLEDVAPGLPDRYQVFPVPFLLTSSIVTSPEPASMGLKAMRGVLDHTYAAPLGAPEAPPEDIQVDIDSYDEACRDAPSIHRESHSFRIGTSGADYRVGGNAMRLFIRGVSITSFLRFSAFHLESITGARK